MNDQPSPFDRERTPEQCAGVRCFGRYLLERKIGEGRMGTVWLANDEKHGRPVALKFLSRQIRRDPDEMLGLRGRVRRCRDLAHANIARIHGFEEDAKLAAIVMEYVAGETLATRKAEKTNGCFDVPEVAPLLSQLCSALDYAHQGRTPTVHRNLKPANLVVDSSGGLKITDFGTASDLHEVRSRSELARGDGRTLAFMCPQRLAGSPPEPAHDIYALGATLYDLLTGTPPFFDSDILAKIHTANPSPLMQRRAELRRSGVPIPSAWERVVLACLAKQACDRPSSAGEVARLLGLPVGHFPEQKPLRSGDIDVGRPRPVPVSDWSPQGWSTRSTSAMVARPEGLSAERLTLHVGPAGVAFARIPAAPAKGLGEFFISATPVTQRLFEKVMGENPSRIVGDQQDYAVNWVSADMAMDFCRTLGRNARDFSLRLPTAGEFIHAATADSGAKWYWGDSDLRRKHCVAELERLTGAQLQQLAGNRSQTFIGSASRVGTKSPNRWGMWDAFGCVDELVSTPDGFARMRDDGRVEPLSGQARAIDVGFRIVAVRRA